MSLPGAIAEQLIFSVLLNGTGMSEKKNQFGLGLAALSLFLGLAGLGFLIAAGYGYMQDEFGVRAATLFMAAIILGCALLSSLTAYGLFRYRQRRRRFYQRTIMQNVQAFVEEVCNELEEPIRENPKTAALIAGLAGFAAAQRLH
jgi:hypothetical protein